ncbi:hypothetical protein JQ615_38495 [Bradyrhizobium jicamae]|uniref:Uncharacterized protein n=1 Tax=Bradyrhizobium jicamae TaxID=280332 RepID=A0ABS5FWM8_9BRAD|nr:hypothetical protein [Bradyrhizobium jicamae]MBR0801258.1 hypothetical protein [Bradyrhizobium jicamae]
MNIVSANSVAEEMLVNRDHARETRPPVFLFSPRNFTGDPANEDNPSITLRGVERYDVRGKRYSVPVHIEHQALQYMVDHMPAAQHQTAAELLAGLTNRGVITSGGIERPTGFKLLVARNDADLETLRQLDRLTRMVVGELQRRLIAFLRTPTLRDQIDRSTAESIFTLGQYIVLLERGRLSCQMTKIQAGDKDPSTCF